MDHRIVRNGDGLRASPVHDLCTHLSLALHSTAMLSTTNKMQQDFSEASEQLRTDELIMHSFS